MKISKFIASLTLATVLALPMAFGQGAAATTQTKEKPAKKPSMMQKIKDKMSKHGKKDDKMAKGKADKMDKKSDKKGPARDAKGRFVKKDKGGDMAGKTMGGVKYDKNGRAHDAKTGRFVKDPNKKGK